MKDWTCPGRGGRSLLGRLVRLATCAALGGGCTALSGPSVEPLLDAAEVERRVQLWRVQTADTVQPPTTQTPDDDDDDFLKLPYRLNRRNIVRIAYHKSPLVTASREEMIAAQHGLEEFKTNLSRFEPFVEVSGDATHFPERRDSDGLAGEIVGGIEKETFDGAVFRVEGGVSASRVEFGQVDEGQQRIEEGSGGLVRARVEVPFAGSRKRQSRVIAAAFQESTARGAILGFLDDYRRYVRLALRYYHFALRYLDYARAYETKIDRLNVLLDDERVSPEDRERVMSSIGDARVLADQYRSYYRTYLLYLLQYLGIRPGEAYVLEECADEISPYLEPSRTREGKERLLADAFANNPEFRVLRDAIKDAELKRAQAIQGDLDITAFVQGTQFAFGSETFDDRVGGWEVTAGVTVRLNDQRVLTASRRKAEAEIREYRAQIRAEELRVQRSIATQSDKLFSYHQSQQQIRDNLHQTQVEYEQRSEAYLNGAQSNLTIEDVLSALNSYISALIRLASNRYSTWLAEQTLMTDTGEVYQLVGMEFGEGNESIEIPERMSAEEHGR